MSMNEWKLIGLLCIGLNIFQKQLENSLEMKITIIHGIPAYDSTMCRFTDFMLKGKSLLVNMNLFSPNDYGKDGKIILKYFRRLKR